MTDRTLHMKSHGTMNDHEWKPMNLTSRNELFAWDARLEKL